MDPLTIITMAFEAYKETLAFESMLFNALPDPEKAAFATRWSDEQKVWHDFLMWIQGLFAPLAGTLKVAPPVAG